MSGRVQLEVCDFIYHESKGLKQLPIHFFSSLAAYSLQQLGLLNVTDMIGGYEAWKSAGLPIDLDSRQESRSLISRAGSVV